MELKKEGRKEGQHCKYKAREKIKCRFLSAPERGCIGPQNQSFVYWWIYRKAQEEM